MPRSAPHPITIFGRPTCEDTAVIRARLRAFDIPFSEVDVDHDAGAARLCESLNDGNRVTPTMLFRGMDDVLSEPSLDVLDAKLADQGWRVQRPEPVTYRGEQASRAVPLLSMAAADGTTFDLSQFRGRRQLAVFIAHSATCLACSGYARQVAAAGARLAESDTTALVVVPGDATDAARWREESTAGVAIVGDHGGRWRAAVAACLGTDVDAPGAMLLGLDRWLAPRVGTSAPDVGGLATPFQVAEWLEFVALQCGSGGGPVDWLES